MACCGRNLPQTKRIAYPQPTTDMLYTTDKVSILGLDSRQYSIQSPMVRTPGRPTGGWRVTIPINGQSVQVDGHNPVQVYNNAVVTLRRNGVEVSATDIWLNLNIQWLGRTAEKYHVVPLSDLMLVARSTGEKKVVVDSRRRNYKPSDWGRLAWGWLNLFLAREEFHFRDFLTQLAYVQDLLNPDTNPEIGCAECYREFSIAIGKLKGRPGMDREEARVWLVDFHNSVNKRIGKKVLSFEEASKLAYWT